MAHLFDCLKFWLSDREFVHFLPNPTICVSGTSASGWGLICLTFIFRFAWGLVVVEP